MHISYFTDFIYQVNPQQTEKLYRKAISCAKLTGKETVIDAYCGTGTIGLIASSRAKHVIGVELNRDAIKDAISNAKRNHIHNVTFYNEDAGQFMVEMAEKGEHADVVIMDPPRTGSDEAFLSSVVRLAPNKVVYVSCGPETLVRDLKYLTKHGYRMKECTPFDLFRLRNMWRRLSYFPRALKVRWTFAQRAPKWNGEWPTAEK